MAKFKVEVIKEDCIGCGACAAACPDNFEMEGDKAVVKKAMIDEIGCSQDAADGCPVSCIKITKLK